MDDVAWHVMMMDDDRWMMFNDQDGDSNDDGGIMIGPSGCLLPPNPPPSGGGNPTDPPKYPPYGIPPKMTHFKMSQNVPKSEFQNVPTGRIIKYPTKIGKNGPFSDPPVYPPK